MDEKTETHLPDLPEAGGIAYTDIWTKTGVEISITARATTATEALDQLYAAIAHGIKEYGMLTSPTQVPRPTPEQVSADVQANGRKRQTKPAPAPVETSADPPGEADSRGNVPGTRDSIEVSRIGIIPVKGGKAKLAFYPFLSNGKYGQYPDVYETRGVEDWSKITNWDPDTFTAAGEITFNQGELTLTFEVSQNQTSKGNYYLNFRELVFS